MKTAHALLWATAIAVAPLRAACGTGLFEHPVDPADPAPAFLETVEVLQSHEVLRGRFQQQKNLAVLAKPFLSEGKFVFSREKGLLWDILQPLPGTYVFTPDGIKTVQSDTGDGDPAGLSSSMTQNVGTLFSSILGADVDQLSEYFKVYHRVSDGRWHIGLKPDARLLSQMIRHITFSGREHIETIVINQGGGDSTTITFSGVEAAEQISRSESGLFERAR